MGLRRGGDQFVIRTYGGKSFAEKHRIELRNRRRRPDESISNLHVDIRRLAALAFPDVERKARDHFLDALDDPDLALKIRERQPSNLDSALRIALQLEVWTTAVSYTHLTLPTNREV